MQTLQLTHWELVQLTRLFHEERNAIISTRQQRRETKQQANALFDKLRFAEFDEREVCPTCQKECEQ